MSLAQAKRNAARSSCLNVASHGLIVRGHGGETSPLHPSTILLDLVWHFWPRRCDGLDEICNDLITSLLASRLNLLFLGCSVLVSVLLRGFVATRLLDVHQPVCH